MFQGRKVPVSKAEGRQDKPLDQNCFIVCETNLEQIFVHIRNIQPDFVIIDSIQTIFTEVRNLPRVVCHNVRESSAAFIKVCKGKWHPVFSDWTY